MRKYNAVADFCPVSKTVEIINTPWKVLIIYRLMDGKLRFNEFRREIPDISEKVLSKSLKELESCNVITRNETHNKALRVEYALTEMGEGLRPVIDSVTDFGNLFFKPDAPETTEVN